MSWDYRVIEKKDDTGTTFAIHGSPGRKPRSSDL